MSKAESTGSELIGTWMVEYIYDRPVIDHSPASIMFAQGDRLVGNASCNNYFGSYKVSGSNLALATAGKTNKLCTVVALMEQESRFLDTLPAVNSYEILEGILFLKDTRGETALRAAHEE